MEIEPQAMKALLDAFDKSDWQEMTVTVGDDRLHVSRRASSDGAVGAESPAPPPPAPPPASPSPVAPVAPLASAASPAASEHAKPAGGAGASVEVPPAGTLIESPSIGLFWRSPAPGAPPFVSEGATVAEGDTLAIVEVMKLMNHVVAPIAGVVTKILPADGETVEYGQALIVIDAEG